MRQGIRFLARHRAHTDLTTCWVHTTLARYGCEYPCLLRKIYSWGFIYHFQLPWNGFDRPVRSVGVTLEGFLLMDCVANRSARIQRRCRILEIVLTTCWVHTALARYGYECPCLLFNICVYIYVWVSYIIFQT